METALDPQAVWEALEAGRKELILALEDKLHAERAYDFSEAEVYRAARKSGLSVDDAKREAKAGAQMQEMRERMDLASAAHLSAKLKYENLLVLAEMRRSEETTRRQLLR